MYPCTRVNRNPLPTTLDMHLMLWAAACAYYMAYITSSCTLLIYQNFSYHFLYQAHGAIAIGLYRRQVCSTANNSSSNNDDDDDDWQFGQEIGSGGEDGGSFSDSSLNHGRDHDHEGTEGRRTREPHPLPHPCVYTCSDTLPYVITAPANNLTVLATDEIFILRQSSSSLLSV